MKPFLISLLTIVLLLHFDGPSGWSAEALPPGVLRKGSLSNEKLKFDASVAAVGKLAAMGHAVDPRRVSFEPYVVAMPEGPRGQRRWAERWYFAVKGKQIPVTIDFKEDGLGAASYVIRK